MAKIVLRDKKEKTSKISVKVSSGCADSALLILRYEYQQHLNNGDVKSLVVSKAPEEAIQYI